MGILSMLSSISTALSGLAAATRRIDVAASNIANAQTAGALPGNPGSAPYVPMQVVQSETSPGSGTTAYTAPVNPTYVAVYDPQSPDADAQGLVAMPNVDPTQEILQLATARQSFAANLKTVQAAISMTDQLLAIV
jgi:flagellar basal-body rod protein FlgC